MDKDFLRKGHIRKPLSYSTQKEKSFVITKQGKSFISLTITLMTIPLLLAWLKAKASPCYLFFLQFILRLFINMIRLDESLNDNEYEYMNMPIDYYFW